MSEVCSCGPTRRMSIVLPSIACRNGSLRNGGGFGRSWSARNRRILVEPGEGKRREAVTRGEKRSREEIREAVPRGEKRFQEKRRGSKRREAVPREEKRLQEKRSGYKRREEVIREKRL